MAALLTRAQMHPLGTGLDAFLADALLRVLDGGDGGKMGTGLIVHGWNGWYAETDWSHRATSARRACGISDSPAGDSRLQKRSSRRWARYRRRNTARRNGGWRF